jgi:hypothetical protein
MLERIYVLSHTDLDGYFSAGLVETLYKRKVNHEVTFKHKSWTYGRDLPSVDYIKNNFDAVFIVDLCPDFDFMYDLWKKFQHNFIWIDHHIKPDTEFLERFNKLNENNFVICGERETVEHRSSAAALTYRYFEPDTDIPWWLKCVSDFDCLNRSSEYAWQNIIMPMFSILKNKVCSPLDACNYIEERMKNDEFYNTDAGNIKTRAEIDVGKIVYTTVKASYNSDAKHGFERIFEAVNVKAGYTVSRKYKAWICNTQNRSSVIFEDMPNKDDYDVFIPYHFNGEKYLYSMYTFKEDIHCNEMNIVNDYSGFMGVPDIVSTQNGLKKIVLSFNGHKDAAGANSENFIF